jgi:hypothetical protein
MTTDISWACGIKDCLVVAEIRFENRGLTDGLPRLKFSFSWLKLLHLVQTSLDGVFTHELTSSFTFLEG